MRGERERVDVAGARLRSVSSGPRVISQCESVDEILPRARPATTSIIPARALPPQLLSGSPPARLMWRSRSPR